MSTFTFIGLTLFGFYLVYRAVTSIDKIDVISKKGIKTQALVTSIREVRNNDHDSDPDTDGYTINHNQVNYFYTVKFSDKKNVEIEKEIEFSTTEDPKRNPPFNTGIIYLSKENKGIDIILENNKGRNSKFYYILIIGFIILSFVVYNYDGQLQTIFNFVTK